MRTLIINLFLITFFISCSSEIDTFDYDPAYKIEVNFKTGQVKEGDKVLQTTNTELREICLKALRNEALPKGYKAEILCLGSGENNVHYHYLKIVSTKTIEHYLITTNDTLILVHNVPTYKQNNCLKRWIISK